MKRYPLIGTNALQVGKSIDLANAALFLKTSTDGVDADTWLLMKFGEGDFTWTMAQEPTYERNRKKLDDVTAGVENPMEISFEGKATFVMSNTDEPFTIHEILTGRNFETGAMQFIGLGEPWLTTYGCPPYAAELELHLVPQIECPLSTVLGEAFLFRYFRQSSIAWNLSSKRVSVRGAAHITYPFAQRPIFSTLYSDELSNGVLLESELKPLSEIGGEAWPDDPRDV